MDWYTSVQSVVIYSTNLTVLMMIATTIRSTTPPADDPIIVGFSQDCKIHRAEILYCLNLIIRKCWFAGIFYGFCNIYWQILASFCNTFYNCLGIILCDFSKYLSENFTRQRKKTWKGLASRIDAI